MTGKKTSNSKNSARKQKRGLKDLTRSRLELSASQTKVIKGGGSPLPESQDDKHKGE